MHPPSILPTAAVPRLATQCCALPVPCRSADALALVASLDRQADLHLSEGRAWHANRLSHLAHQVRCRAMEAAV